MYRFRARNGLRGANGGGIEVKTELRGMRKDETESIYAIRSMRKDEIEMKGACALRAKAKRNENCLALKAER